MNPSELAAAVEASPAYGKLDPRVRELVSRACEVLAASPQGLPPESLRKALRAWFSGQVLEDMMSSTLERYGLFRWDARGCWTLADPAWLSRTIDRLPVAVFDVEATGGRPPLHRIIEIGLVRIEPEGSETTFESLVNPGRPLPPYITFMTGLKQAHVDGAPPMADLLPRIEQLLEGALVVAHDVTGDIELLDYELVRESKGLLANPVVCTVAVCRGLRPVLERHGLEFVCSELGITFEQEHRALGDARATAAVWTILKQELLEQGLRTVLDLTAFQGQVVVPNFLSSRLSVERLDEAPAAPGLLRLLGAGGRVVHLEAVADLRKALREYFYPRHKQPPFLKKTLREAVDLSFETYPTLAEAQEAHKVEKAKLPPPKKRKWRRR